MLHVKRLNSVLVSEAISFLEHSPELKRLKVFVWRFF